MRGCERALLGVAAFTCGLGAYALALRPRILSWGATRDEVAATYPGDDLIPDATAGATRAATLPAPPESVWPWLVQMGCARGGWYSWDFLDNGGNPSADTIVQQWQHIVEGQHLERVGNPLDAGSGAPNWWSVTVLEANRTLVLHTAYSLLRVDPNAGVSAPGRVEGIWGFHLRPAAGDQTRLVVRTRSRGDRSCLGCLVTVMIGEPLHFVMQLRQLQNLLARTQSSAGESLLPGRCVPSQTRPHARPNGS